MEWRDARKATMRMRLQNAQEEVVVVSTTQVLAVSCRNRDRASSAGLDLQVPV